LTASALIVSSCGSKKVTPVEQLKVTPVEQLKAVIEQHKDKVNQGGTWNPGDSVGRRIVASQVIDVSYDVQKTDSLVSPYLGIATYEVRYTLTTGNKKDTGNYTCRATYAYQDKAWVSKSYEYWDFYKKWQKVLIGEENVRVIACGFTASNVNASQQ
jgi:hypothetical protein